MKLGGGRYQAPTKVKVLSPETNNVSEADSVFVLEGSTVRVRKGKDSAARRGQRPVA